MGVRRKARECALELLYQIEINKFSNDQIVDVIQDYWADKQESKKPLEKKSKEFAESIVRGAIEHREKIDELINKHATNWELNRIAKIDKNIMRMALYEMLYLKDIPIAVTINEAVEIAKKYASAESDKFINAILDNIRKAEIHE